MHDPARNLFSNSFVATIDGFMSETITNYNRAVQTMCDRFGVLLAREFPWVVPPSQNRGIFELVGPTEGVCLFSFKTYFSMTAQKTDAAGGLVDAYIYEQNPNTVFWTGLGQYETFRGNVKFSGPLCLSVYRGKRHSVYYMAAVSGLNSIQL